MSLDIIDGGASDDDPEVKAGMSVLAELRAGESDVPVFGTAGKRTSDTTQSLHERIPACDGCGIAGRELAQIDLHTLLRSPGVEDLSPEHVPVHVLQLDDPVDGAPASV